MNFGQWKVFVTLRYNQYVNNPGIWDYPNPIQMSSLTPCFFGRFLLNSKALFLAWALAPHTFQVGLEAPDANLTDSWRIAAVASVGSQALEMQASLF